MMRDYVTMALKKAAPGIPFSITIPEHAEHGDYATNVVFLLARRLVRQSFSVGGSLGEGGLAKEKKSPKEIAENLIQKIDTKAFEKIEIAGNGFINFFLKKELLYKELEAVLKEKKSYGKGASKKERRNIEFISANPTGPITLGNGRGAFLGDALVKTLRYSGFNVESDFYVNDAKVGGQVQSLGNAVKGSDNAYPYIHDLYIKNDSHLKKRLENLPPTEAGYELTQIIHKKNEETLKKIGIHIDNFFHEQKLYDDKKIETITEIFSQKKLTYQEEGALWLKTSTFGDDKDKVLIRSTGAPTYLLTDLAYHWDKFTQRNFDRVINILGADHHGTIQSFKAALKALGIEENRFTAIIIQTVRFMENGEERKMSKRKGEFVTFEDLIEEIGADAARYFFLEKSPDTHMDFDLGLAKERSVKNPVYYIQYAHARCSSILREANQKIQKATSYELQATNLLKEQEEFALIKKMAQFPEIIEDTAKDYHVHRIPRYAYELAQTFHNFYEKHRVITDDQNLTESRLTLVKATKIVLQNTLEILGISAPEKM